MRDVEIPKWLEGLPLAPEFRPTDTEFADPIAYISKIEKEASAFGICKVIPPFPKPSKKYVLYNLNKSLSKCPELGSDVNIGSSRKMNDGVEGTTDCEFKAVFTTRHQELGQSGKRAKGAVGNQPIGAPKQVWQSGEVYTLEEFEAKSKNFAKSQLGMVKEVAPLVIEAMFWKATSEKPIYVEYANDVPGSGFGEPEGSFRYFNRQRRRRRKRGTFDRNNQGSSCSKNDHITNNSSSMNCSSVDKNADVSNLHTEVSGTSTSLPSLSSDQSNIISQGMFSNASDEMQGTAGWKLSNSSWNLQVIARSPGSITRYMPDDIPGVTSPMVYIGMLFSWFAWHVEDHELHSLNFLHTGSPKTWYAVPGDYAFDFEEVIRLYAYGGDTNSLDALTLLGEKTTLFSPEIIVAAGIPCCRLVQNPGEFVVTFPRAYHVGFSHGFNCGEAANFSTPKWLTVAKGAAVRRAAMNYLPMLSHQQLLYLLTMSFVSRVPRCLLPGARSSRLKDRQKEERELSVKKAFLEDILNENRLLTILLQKNPSYHVVLWDLDLLPASSKDSELCSTVDADGTKSREDSHSGECDNQDLYTQMSLYMDTFTDFYLDDADDLQNDYQVDSGTLPCVACGILGFPFMAVVQPSEQASRDLLPEDQDLVLQLGVSQPVGFETLDLNCRAERSAPDTRKPNEKNLVNHPNETSLLAESNPAACPMKEDQSPLLNHSSSPEHVTVSSAVKPEKLRNLSTEYLRPRLFCLEHAIQTVELLRPKGGANVLGICHSDFQKIKAQSAVVAEEISSRFTYKEIPLGNASPDDLYLIDHAIDNQENDECTQDWTSKLNINLRHCVKMRKNFPSQNVKHALTLGGLFSDTVSKLKALNWQSRKSRTKHKSSPTILSKQSLSIQTEKVEEPVVNSDSGTSKKLGKVIIQYYRKRCKSKPCGSEGVSKAIVDSDMHPPDDLSAADGGYCDKKEKDTSQDTLVRVEDAGNGSSEPSFLASSRLSKLQSEDQITMSAEDLNGNSSLPKIVDSYIATTPLAENIDARTGNHMFEELIGMDKICDPPLNDFQKLPMIHVVEDIAGNHDTAGFENSAGSIGITMYCNENSEVTREYRIVSETNTANWTCDLVETDESGRQCNIQADGDVLMKEASNSANLCPRANDSSGGRCSEHLETTDVDECGMSSGKKQKEIHPIKGDDQEGAVLSNVPLSSTFKPTLSEGVEAPGEMPAHEQQHSGNLWSSSSFENKELNDAISTLAQFRPTEKTRSKRKREVEIQNEDSTNFGSFSRSPCEGLRPRAKSDAAETDSKKPIEDKREARKVNKHLDGSPLHKDKKEQKKGSHRCSIEGCRMSFQTKSELVLHMHDRCPIRGCGKKFNSHKYAILHQRVHDDDRPLKCPWKGCTMTFKWAWARTEHIRVHTGERPYKCKVEGCGLTFRFVSDFSRHRRKTGHYVN